MTRFENYQEAKKLLMKEQCSITDFKTIRSLISNGLYVNYRNNHYDEIEFSKQKWEFFTTSKKFLDNFGDKLSTKVIRKNLEKFIILNPNEHLSKKCKSNHLWEFLLFLQTGKMVNVTKIEFVTLENGFKFENVYYKLDQKYKLQNTSPTIKNTIHLKTKTILSTISE